MICQNYKCNKEIPDGTKKCSHCNWVQKDRTAAATVKKETVEIKIIQGDVKQLTKTFKIPFEIKLLKGGKALADTLVRIKKGISFVKQEKTNGFGEIIFTYEEPLSMQAQSVSLRFILDGEYAGTEKEVTFALPAIPSTAETETTSVSSEPKPDPQKERSETEKPKVEDPENLDLCAYHDDGWRYTLCVRVTKTNGIGISVPVAVYVDGEEAKLTTDDQGNASMGVAKILQPEQICEVRAVVSGIRDAAKLTLKRPKTETPAESRLSWAWLFGKNNGRAILFAGIAIISWIFCLLIGWGDPILNPPATELSVQQQMYNSIVAGVNPVLIIQPEKSAGNWQKYFWLFSFLWTIFVTIYAPLSLREEIAEGFKNGIDKMLDKLRQTSDTASDPLIDKLMAWSNTHARIKKQQPKVTVTATRTATTPETAEAEAPKLKTLTHWDIIKWDTIMEMAWKVIPEIFKMVFKK